MAKQDLSLHTLRVQINVRVQIIVRGGNFWKINKHTGPNKCTGWKIFILFPNGQFENCEYSCFWADICKDLQEVIF